MSSTPRFDAGSVSPLRRAATESFFKPSSVAIIGASADPRKWGYMAAEQALRNRDLRRVHLVNSRGGEILGETCLKSAAELPLGVELAIVTVPPSAFEVTIDALLARNVRAIVAITSGFGEASAEGREVERRVAERVRAAGAELVGPNCMGVFDGLAPFRCMPWTEIAPGPIGFVSQSGGLIMDLCFRLADSGLGLSRAVSLGNQADLSAVDFIGNFGRHDDTAVIAVYCEAIADAEEFFGTVRQVVAGGKPVVILSPDFTEGARRAALGHTGSQLTDRKTVRAAAESAGAAYVTSVADLAATAQALLSGERGRGRRAVVASDTGGPGVLLAGAVERAGLELRPLSTALRAMLSSQLGPRAVTGNPIDFVDNLNVEPAVDVMRTLGASDEVDAVLMNLHVFVHETPALEADVGRRLAAVAHASGKPLVISCRALDAPGVRALAAARIPVYRDGEVAARMLALLCGGTSSGAPGSDQ